MASNTRSGRRSATSNASSPQLDLPSLTNVERLLVAQAVHEFGANAWSSVSKLLSKHPMITRPKYYFAAQSCHTIYDYLMKEAELEITEANSNPKDPSNLPLAQRHYQARILELRSYILEEETKFKRVVAEIEEIRSGLWDNKLKSNISGVPMAHSPSAERDQTLSEKPPITQTDDVLIPGTVTADESSSDLTGVTDSDDAVKIPKADELSLDDEGIEVQVIDEEPLGNPNYTNIPAHAAIDADVLRASSSTEEAPPDEDADTAEKSTEVKSPEVDTMVVKSPDREEEGMVEADSDDSVMDVDIEAADTPKDRLESPLAPSKRRESKRKASEVRGSSRDAHREKKKPREDSEPMDEDETGLTSSTSRRRRERQALTEEQVASKRFQNVIGMLHSQISQHRNGNIFHNPIKDSEAPDYREIVKRPMDLKTIKARVKDGGIKNTPEFQRDVWLMFANAMMYNRPDSDIYTMAGEMMKESEAHINAHRQTEGLIGGQGTSR